MINLLDETILRLSEHSKSPEDVLWVGNLDSHMTWAEFSKRANFNYDNGYGCAEVDDYMKIVGDNWWMERVEYDGSEWWDFKSYPVKPEAHKEFRLSPRDTIKTSEG